MGIALQEFRLVRATGKAGCDHHLLVRSGRPSYPNADQGAEDAADSFPGVVMDALTAWWKQWVLPAQCRWAGNEPGEHDFAVTDPVDVVESESVDLYNDPGMRSLDVWVADRGRGHGAVVGAVADAAAFRAAAAEESDGEALGPPARLRVLLLAEGSGAGDLRDV
jgi:hypothetical protein